MSTTSNASATAPPNGALPRATQPFVEFSTILRANGFSVAPDQTQNFIAAVGLLGPRDMDDIHRAALATLAPPPERRDEFDALFRMVFLGQTLVAPAAEGAEEEELRAFDDRDGAMEPPEIDDMRESGAEATATEHLTARAFAPGDTRETLARFRRAAPAALPQMKSRRFFSSSTGRRPDMRRALREAVKRDGEVVQLPALARRPRQRRILLLIDISGSMKELTDGHLRFAHALAQVSDRLEVFTLGTRLTRITRAAKMRNPEHGLSAASALVADWDGGTRLGDALAAFLAVPRFVGFARGSLTVIVSDGLERGEPSALIDAMERFSRLSWSTLWLTPLAEGDGFVPQTQALAAIDRHVGRFASSSDIDALCRSVLDHARAAA